MKDIHLAIYEVNRRIVEIVVDRNRKLLYSFLINITLNISLPTRNNDAVISENCIGRRRWFSS